MYKYKATKLIVDVFRDNDLKFDVDSNLHQEVIRAGFSIDGGPRVIAAFISRDDDNDVALRILGLITKVPEEKRTRVMEACNILNTKIRYLKFNVDVDGDINVEYDFPINSGDDCLGTMAVEMFARTMKILDAEYKIFMKAIYTDETLRDEDMDRKVRETMIRKLEEMMESGDIPESADIEISSVGDIVKAPNPFEDICSDEDVAC